MDYNRYQHFIEELGRQVTEEMKDFEQYRRKIEQESEETEIKPSKFISKYDQLIELKFKCEEYPRTKARKRIIGYVNLESD